MHRVAACKPLEKGAGGERNVTANGSGCVEKFFAQRCVIRIWAASTLAMKRRGIAIRVKGIINRQ